MMTACLILFLVLLNSTYSEIVSEKNPEIILRLIITSMREFSNLNLDSCNLCLLTVGLT